MEMIVGCINEKTVEGCIRAIRSAARQGASLVELRIDHLDAQDAVSLRKIISASPLPVIATVRRKRNGGLFEGEEQERMEILKAAIEVGAKYIDVEMDAADDLDKIRTLANARKCKIVVSQHDFKGTPDIGVLLNWLNKASRLGDIVKIVTKANDVEDCTRILNLLGIARQKRIRLVAFAMGEKGRFTRIVSLLYGSLWTYCATTKPLAAGQMSIRESKGSMRLLK